MATTRVRMTRLFNYATERNCLSYVYGGSFTEDPTDSTDCSGLVFSGAAIVNGQDPNRRYGSTETVRLARLNGIPAPCGLQPASSLAAIPADAPFRAGFQHGGGGENSHTACSFWVGGRRYNWESRGWPGVILDRCGDQVARGYDDPLFHDWWYIPGPVDGTIDPTAFPLPDGYYYGPYEGPDESISGRAGEPVEWVDGLRRWQTQAGVPADGIYGERTRARAIELQVPAGLLPDGKIGPKTWALAFKAGAPVPDNMEQLFARITEYVKGYVGPVGSDVKDIREQLTGGRDLIVRSDGSTDLAASFPGYPELGKRADGTNRTLVDAVAALLHKEGLA